ncbi:hypothetical protein ACSESE_11420 [Pseudomonas aeruginosa]
MSNEDWNELDESYRSALSGALETAHPAVEQAGGDERDLQGAQGERDGWGPLPIVQVPWNVFDRAVMWVEDRRRYGDDGTIVDDWKALKTIQRAALAQPSPAQAEQAEAERPEVAEVAFVLRNIGAMDAEDIDGDNVDLRFEDAEGRDTGCDVSIVEYAEKAADLLEQHDRIVGALRARNEKLEADAGALEWLRSTFKVHKAIVEQAGCGTIEQLAEQRDAANSRLHEVSVACATAEQERDAALARIAELEAALSSALSQHGVKFMDPPDGGDTPLIEQVCRMSQALSELEKQEPVGEVRESGGTLTAVIVRHSYATKLPVGTKLYAAPVSQAQHSVPGDIMRDAQRYRWLRDQQFYFSFSTENSDAGISSCTAGMSSRFKNLSWVDAAIDSAIAAAPGKEGV